MMNNGKGVGDTGSQVHQKVYREEDGGVRRKTWWKRHEGVENMYGLIVNGEHY